MGKVNHYLASHTLSENERNQYAEFFRDAPAEVRFTAWKALGQNMENLVPIHNLVKPYLLDSTQQTANQTTAPVAPTPAATVTTPAAVKPRKRR